MKNIFLTFVMSFITFFSFSQYHIDSIHYMLVEPSVVFKNGKERKAKEGYLFHMTRELVHPFVGTVNKKSYTIVEKSLDGSCVIISAVKDNVFKKEVVFSIPVDDESNFTMTTKRHQIVSNKFKLIIENYTNVIF